ncbi:hypothetical protein BDZ91DRAFT_709027 [Kalaharituber pfeilii]|nr:hypothetical protein BDZ91DRAFT_709027 [Kalaharituber pfeilii]
MTDLAATAPATHGAIATDSEPQTQQKQPQIVLHWLDDSRAQRIVWLLEELGLKYDIKPYKRINHVAPPELKAIHPLGKSPVLTYDDLVLAESGYITDFLTRTYSRLRPSPSSPPSHHHLYNYLLHYAEGTLMPPLTIAYILQVVKSAPVPFFVKPITSMIVNKVYENYLGRTLGANFDFLEGLLGEDGGKEYFVANEFTAIDVLLSYPIFESAEKRVRAGAGTGANFTRERYPRLFAWMERIKEREAFKRAEERTRGF